MFRSEPACLTATGQRLGQLDEIQEFNPRISPKLCLSDDLLKKTAKGLGMIIYGLKNCDTCRKARKALPDAQFVDVRDEGLPDVVRDSALTHFGERLLNTRSTTWRGLTEAERAQLPEALLAAHPALMKRPLIAAGDNLILGWDAAAQKAAAAFAE